MLGEFKAGTLAVLTLTRELTVKEVQETGHSASGEEVSSVLKIHMVTRGNFRSRASNILF